MFTSVVKVFSETVQLRVPVMLGLTHLYCM